MMDEHNDRSRAGKHAEQYVSNFLQLQGLQLIAHNYSCPLGEIDLIMRDGNDIVFVEVRSRAYIHFGKPVESINLQKQKKILQTSMHFLQQRNWLDRTNCRFDVVGVSHDNVDWIKNAFTADIL